MKKNHGFVDSELMKTCHEHVTGKQGSSKVTNPVNYELKCPNGKLSDLKTPIKIKKRSSIGQKMD